MERLKIEELIKSLEHARSRPTMYFGKSDAPELTMSYLYGIRHAMFLLFDFEGSIMTIWDKAFKRRGHQFEGSRGPVWGLRQKGLNDSQVVIELIAIEIEFWNVFQDGFAK